MPNREEAIRRQLRHLRRAHHELLLAADVAALVALSVGQDELAAAVIATGLVVQLVDEELARLRECQ